MCYQCETSKPPTLRHKRILITHNYAVIIPHLLIVYCCYDGCLTFFTKNIQETVKYEFPDFFSITLVNELIKCNNE